MPESNLRQEKLQFILTESQLKDIYSSLNYAPDDFTVRTQLLLSKPEREKVSKDEVYADSFILTLSSSEVSEIISRITTSSVYGRPAAASLIRKSIEQGALARESQ